MKKKALFVPVLVLILALSLVASPAGVIPAGTVNVQILAEISSVQDGCNLLKANFIDSRYSDD
jgi:hypothetical protein